MEVDPALSETLLKMILNADRPGAAGVISRALEAGLSAHDIILKVVNVAMDKLGVLQADQLVVLAQVYIAAQIVDDALGRLEPLLTRKRGTHGVVVIANILGDFHSLGRKSVATFLKVAGYQVVDLGANIAPEALVQAAAEHKADVVAVSALLLHTAEKIKEIRPLLEQAGLKRVKILVGGAPFNLDPGLCKRLDADASAPNAHDAVRQVRLLIARPVRIYNETTHSFLWRDALTGRFVPASTHLEEDSHE